MRNSLILIGLTGALLSSTALAADLPMLAEAGVGVAFRAKPRVAEAARVRIEHGDLTALLYLQGFSAAEFAA